MAQRAHFPAADGRPGPVEELEIRGVPLMGRSHSWKYRLYEFCGKR